jgi:(2R)-3-sulfolactate dehydrogenase (NADP+)
MTETRNNETLTMTGEAAYELLLNALRGCGASSGVASSVASSCFDAQAESEGSAGFETAAYYCDALNAGRVNGTTLHATTKPTPVMFCVDAQRGFTHPAFDAEFHEFVAATHQYGIALFNLRNGYTSGALGYYVHRLASVGLVAMAFANAGPAVLAPSGGHRPVFCSNPIAFALPRSSGYPLVIDQSSSQTAIVNLRSAAKRGEEIPPHWALDAQGEPTTDPKRALEGVLLAFGGQRGANIALMVELLAAGVTGANWSLDAASFLEGDKNPGAGLLIIALNPALTCDESFSDRTENYLTRIKTEFDAYIPGERRGKNKVASESAGITVDRDVAERLENFADN